LSSPSLAIGAEPVMTGQQVWIGYDTLKRISLHSLPTLANHSGLVVRVLISLEIRRDFRSRWRLVWIVFHGDALLGNVVR